jgi:[glutamine synthetase] adenylyltransferase / [glutamine synthetase]-adenylyl-L-tyrosine phosphorylase
VPEIDRMLEKATDRARIGIENWLTATGAPELYRQQLESSPALTDALIKLLNCSQAMCDFVAQNPEFPNVLFENVNPTLLPTKDEMRNFGYQILAGSISYSHTLDRLRYLMQRLIFQIALVDVNQWQQPVDVWKALSDLADTILELTYNAAWDNHRRVRFLGELECPLFVIAFGKHGGQEVNYSSDLDLVFVLQDGLEEKVEREAIRFGESFIRALTDRMGRGALYRIDMRLRPYGAAGELAKSMRATEQYYRLYAEAWERQALLRSRVVVGPNWLASRWSTMREDTCFRGHISEFTVFEIQETRVRIDEMADPKDFKRGRGGIRDVEFLVQMLQLVHGSKLPELRGLGTLEVLQACQNEQVLPSSQSEFLMQSYMWLRQLEHRCQLVHNQQTHQLPDDDEEVQRIGNSLGLQDVRQSLAALREQLAEVYTRFSGVGAAGISLHETAQLNHFLGSKINDEVLQSIFLENRDSYARVRRLATLAPLLEPEFQNSWELCESLLSGEIEEESESSNLRTTWTQSWSRYAFGDTSSAKHWNETCRNWLAGQIVGVDTLLLGSAGKGQMGPLSDCDLVFLCTDQKSQIEFENYISDWLKRVPRRPLEIDLRLRPDGGKGLLVRSVEGLLNYAKTDMEPWERYLLGFHCWLKTPDPKCKEALDEIFSIPWTESDDLELKTIKFRVEHERLKDGSRDLKLGPGGLMDLQWIQRVCQLRRVTAPDFDDAENLFIRVRNSLQLLKWNDYLPEDEPGWNLLQESLLDVDIQQKLTDLRHNVRETFLGLYR